MLLSEGFVHDRVPGVCKDLRHSRTVSLAISTASDSM